MFDARLLEDEQTAQQQITGSGSIVSFDSAFVRPLDELKVNITPTQSGEGDPSPTNIRPISGWTGCEVWNDPKYGGTIDWNQLLLNPNFESTSNWTASRATISAVNNVLTMTPSERYGSINQTNRQFTTDHVYAFKMRISSTTAVPMRAYAGTTWVGDTKNVPSGTDYEFFALAKASATTTAVLVIQNNAASDYGVQSFKGVGLYDLTQIFGETKADEIYAMEQAQSGSGLAYFKSLFPKDYYPYNEGEQTCVSAVNGDPYDLYPITWSDSAGTVYGGTLDVTSGKLIVYPYYASYNGETLSGKWISDRDVYVEGTAPTIGAQVVDMSGIGAEYTLTPTEITALIGQNNVWADCGDVSLRLDAVRGKLEFNLIG